MMKGEIFVVSAAGQGHFFPCLELCKQLALRSYRTTLVIPSSVLSSVPDLSHYPVIETAGITAFSGPPSPESDHFREQAIADLETHLSKRFNWPVLCAIVDFQMGWTKNIFWKFNVPVIGFFTFGACAAAMEWGAWKANVGDMKPDEIRLLPGLPNEMALSYSDLKRSPSGPPHGGQPRTDLKKPTGRGGDGPPKPGDRPPWVNEVEGSVALMFNTCEDLERPFINYMANQMGKPAWAVGPLLPEQYWKASSDSLIHDGKVRSHTCQTNYTEDEILQWLDSKSRGSVLYVAFGSEVGSTIEEYPQLAEALEEWTGPFLWAIQSKSSRPGSQEGYFPHGMDTWVGERGLIIYGWAPQLLILSHPSTGGFLSHCGWNSTVEAIGRGVPILTWPRRGDQHYNAKLVVSYLKIGYMATTGDASVMVKKNDILKGIERLMGDEEAKVRAMALRVNFERGFPASSGLCLDDFGNFISQKVA